MIIQIEIPNNQMKTIHQLAIDCHVESEDIIHNIISEWYEEHFPRGVPQSQTLRLEQPTNGPNLDSGQSLEEFCQSYQKANW